MLQEEKEMINQNKYSLYISKVVMPYLKGDDKGIKCGQTAKK